MPRATAAPETPARPRWTGLRGDDSLLLPDAVTAPFAVREADEQAKIAYRRLQAARAEFFSAKERLKLAPRLDRQADAAATASDQPLPARRAEAAAREAFDGAERLLDSCKDAFSESQRRLATMYVTHRGAWIKELDGTIDAAREEVRDLLDRLAGAMDALEAEQRLAEGLRDLPPQGALTTVRMGRLTRHEGTPAQQRAKAIEALRHTDHLGGLSACWIASNQLARWGAGSCRAERAPRRSSRTAACSGARL